VGSSKSEQQRVAGILNETSSFGFAVVEEFSAA
jgi:hypothetical protein